MVKTLKNLLLATALGCGANASVADDFVANLPPDFGAFSISISKSGTSFVDSLLFSVTAPSSITSTAFSNWPVRTAGLRNLTLELFQGSTLIASEGPSEAVPPSGGIPAFTLENLAAFVSPGSYRLTLSGDVQPDGGFYSWTVNTVAVPEPEQWALMIAGLALVAGLASRRRKAAA